MYYLLAYTYNRWTVGEIIKGDDYNKVQRYLQILDRYNYFSRDQSLAHQQQLLQLQQQLDTERRMRRSMALQLDKLRESSANDISSKGILLHYIPVFIAVQST